MDHLQQGAKLRAQSVHQPEKSPLPITFICFVRALQKSNPHAHCSLVASRFQT